MNLLVSDYDKTFYTSNETIYKNIQAVDKFMDNNLFVIATGRSYNTFLDVKNLYNIKYNYLIINHGATILYKDNVLFNSSIDNQIKNKIITNLDLDEAVLYFAYSNLNDNVSLSDNNLTKINIQYRTKEKAKYIVNLINNLYGEYVNCLIVREDKVIEIVSKEATKETAIQFIAQRENINKSDIYTIGDSYTDIGMIKNYNGFAMKDSILEVTKEAIGEYDSVYQLIDDIIDNKYD